MNVGDDILVRWVFQNKAIWWKSVAFSAVPRHYSPNVGKGVLYAAPNTYHSEICAVEFIFQFDGAKMLRTVEWKELSSWVF